MVRSLLTSGHGEFMRVSVNGVDAANAKIARLPPSIKAKIQDALFPIAEQVVARMQSVVRVKSGVTRESIHVEPGRHELSIAVVCDAKDKDGNPFAAPEEYGHKAEDGTHVPAAPFFWPTWRVERKPAKSKISRAATAGVKAVVAGGPNRVD